MMQLVFSFLPPPEAAPPTMSRYRRRLQAIAKRAYRLGLLRGARDGKRQVSKPPPALSAPDSVVR